MVHRSAAGAEAGYLPSEPVILALPEAGRWEEARLSISLTPQAVPMATGQLLVLGSAGSRGVRYDIPLRMARGAVAFVERREIQLDGERKVQELTCIENRHLRAEFMPAAGCMCTLISARGRHDLLVPGDHPLGLHWDGVREWFHSALTPFGPPASAVYTAHAQGGKFTVRAALGDEDEALSVEVDATELPRPPGRLVLLSSASPQGGDMIATPLVSAGASLPLSSDPLRLRASEYRVGWVGLWNAQRDETLLVGYSIPTLLEIRAGAGDQHNYTAFTLDDVSPGKLGLQFAIRPGRVW